MKVTLEAESFDELYQSGGLRPFLRQGVLDFVAWWNMQEHPNGVGFPNEGNVNDFLDALEKDR